MGIYVCFSFCTLLLLSTFCLKIGGYNVCKGFNIIKHQILVQKQKLTLCSTTLDSSVEDSKEVQKKLLTNKLDKDIFAVALPAFVSLAADPLASLVDAIFVGRLGPVEQAAMGIAISAQFSIAKLYNDPLLKTSTSIVAGKTGDELEAAVATAVYTAIIIGAIQTIIFFFFSGGILNMMGVRSISEMRRPAMGYLKYRAFGIPAATMLLVTNSIFRGRGDTITPLYCTSLGTIVNIVLDPFFIFTCQMGCAGAGAATAISQWVTAIPLLYLLNRSVPIKLLGRDKTFFHNAFVAYFKAGVLIFLRTIAKISAYTVTSAAAARLGTIAMAAYSLTFNLGFATSQLCESISIAAQALLARDYPFDTNRKKESVSHVIRRSLLFGFLVSAALSIVTFYNQNGVLAQLTKSPDVFLAAKAVMPVVLMTQLVKGLAYSTGGIILGGLDWFWSSLGMQIAAVVCIGLVYILPPTLWNIWIALGAFMGTQVSDGFIFDFIVV
jgi:putative MATE family efflux protein